MVGARTTKKAALRRPGPSPGNSVALALGKHNSAGGISWCRGMTGNCQRACLRSYIGCVGVTAGHGDACGGTRVVVTAGGPQA